MRTIITLIVIVLLAGLSVYFYRMYQLETNEVEIAAKRIDELEQQLKQQLQQADSLEQYVITPDTMEMVPPGGAAFVDELGSLSEGDISRLQRSGLKNPEAELQTDLLRKQRSLLPAKGTMGGTMQIRDTRILTSRYALAYFEDGHNGGYMLLRYEVKDGAITWKVIDSYMM
ncbi:MAG: hypothetical protein LPJ89_02685 [Hymenobacteraceae bacterium]|nr:hypothetical protein [Hymenobacteraceae bacterium]MDX5395525.1 hypothetical protein [Hymenobacteraceae bacterium]MDX5442672.1 hypothetical protein [Hymenobacteraceae bacterium]MDX5511579.1 hypothetical protein [Hymenobacteraceae bacterium]